MKSYATKFLLCCLVQIFCLPVRPSALAQDTQWTPEQLLRAIRAREDAITSIEAHLVRTTTFSSEWDALRKAERASALAFARLQGITVDSKLIKDSPARQANRTGVEYFRYVRGPSGRERIETLKMGDSGERIVRAVTVSPDGTSFKTFSPEVPDRGSILDARSFEHLGHYLGVDLLWMTSGVGPSAARSIYQALNEAHKAGQLSIGAGGAVEATHDPSLVTVVLRRPLVGANATDLAIFDQMTIWLDEKRGLAPVKSDQRAVRRDGDDYVRLPAPHVAVAYWEEFEEFDGVWLPEKYVVETYRSVVLPKTGDYFEGPFQDFSETKIQTFQEYFGSVVSSELRVNEPVEENWFELEFPQGISVYDSIKGIGYQVGATSPAIDEALLRAIRRNDEKPAWRTQWLPILVACFLVVGTVVASYWWWKRARQPGR